MRKTLLWTIVVCLVVPAAFAAAHPKLKKLKKGKVPNSYIVVFKDSVEDPEAVATSLAAGHGIVKRRVYRHSIKGFSAHMSEARAEALADDPRVAYVEENGSVTVSTNPVWGLDRIDQRPLPLNNQFQPAGTGAGVDVYVLDTGIRITHCEFDTDRADVVFDVFGGDGLDCYGHGTHVAASVGGTVYGVAKGVNLHSVRVLDCYGYGSYEDVIAGVDFVRDVCDPGRAVAVMALSGPRCESFNDAVRVADNEVVFVVAAGNDDEDSCDTSPCTVGSAICVSATDQTDYKASFANTGGCVDIFAPGVSVTSAWYTSDSATATLSGTSMATAYTAGVAALVLNSDPFADELPRKVKDVIIADGSQNRIIGLGESATNLLLYTPPNASTPNYCGPPLRDLDGFFPIASVFLGCAFYIGLGLKRPPTV